ncbi:TMV resistance protein N [Arachis hypogaea]|nr:TMV resistance protein N [Arachis hypogaea]
MAGSSSHFKYDVFLSFRGYTRLRFIDTLYHALINKRIVTFRDSEELRIGEELEGALLEAIERSRMSILILCDEYPASKWCLDELVKIMECSENGRKRPVLPVYYYVEKSDVQYQLNEYAKAMAAHKEKGRYNHKLESWKSALSQVGKIYGQRCNQNTPWGKTIDKIVEEVSKRLPPLPLYVDRPLGFESELEEAKSLLEIDSHATSFMVGIHGDGELSKFVAELYNKIRPHFVAGSFLSNVSEKTNENSGGLEDLQKTLLSEMGEEVKTKIGSTFKGSSEIRQRLGQKRVVLVLDDVDRIQQLNSLAGGIDWFGPGSRIIITTRNEDLLREHELNNGVEIRRHCIVGRQVEEDDADKGDVVGLLDDFSFVIEELYDANNDVVSIIGMGGSGKTTLAQKIYKNKEVKGFFPCRGWSHVSKDYKPREVFLRLLHSLMKSTSTYENLEMEDLKKIVSNYLKGRKYLIVLDDMWEPEGHDQSHGCTKLSYDSLSEELKPCFRYLGIYPEDFKIPTTELIQLWMAEGFIKESGLPNSPEPEVVGEEYFKELVDRNMVLVSRQRSDGGVKECLIHDLFRDLCIILSKADNFFEVCTGSNIHTLSNPLRLSLLCSEVSYMSSIETNQSSTRSLFFFAGEDSSHDSLKYFQSVQVLHLGGQAWFLRVPSNFQAMIFLNLQHLVSLHKLKLNCCPSNLSIHAKWFPLNLAKITLRAFGEMDCSSMKALGQFPNLQVLKLLGGTIPDPLDCATGDFPKLQVFKMMQVQVQSWTLEKGAMPRLRYLLIWDCIGLCQLPEQLWSLTTLAKVRVTDPSEELRNSLQDVKVKHNCDLKIAHSIGIALRRRMLKDTLK